MDEMSHRKILLLSTAKTGRIYRLLRLLQENRLTEYLGCLASVRVIYLSVIATLNTCLTVFRIAGPSCIMCSEFSDICPNTFPNLCKRWQQQTSKTRGIGTCCKQIMEVLSVLVLKAYPFFPAIPLGLVKVLPYTASFALPKIGKNDPSQRNDKKSFTFYSMKGFVLGFSNICLFLFKKPLEGETSVKM